MKNSFKVSREFDIFGVGFYVCLSLALLCFAAIAVITLYAKPGDPDVGFADNIAPMMILQQQQFQQQMLTMPK